MDLIVELVRSCVLVALLLDVDEESRVPELDTAQHAFDVSCLGGYALLYLKLPRFASLTRH